MMWVKGEGKIADFSFPFHPHHVKSAYFKLVSTRAQLVDLDGDL